MPLLRHPRDAGEERSTANDDLERGQPHLLEIKRQIALVQEEAATVGRESRAVRAQIKKLKEKQNLLRRSIRKNEKNKADLERNIREVQAKKV